jgi:hypothetical protein
MNEKLNTDLVLTSLTRKLVKALSLVALGMILSGLIQARSGSLDLTFGNGGKVIDREIDEPASKIAIQSDGKIVVAGWHADQSGTHFFLARYNKNGSIDTSLVSVARSIQPTRSQQSPSLLRFNLMAES